MLKEIQGQREHPFAACVREHVFFHVVLIQDYEIPAPSGSL